MRIDQLGCHFIMLGEKQERLGKAPLGKLLADFALPAVIAMTAVSLYNIVDSVFIGRQLGTLGLAGLTVTFPLMNLSGAFGAMVGVGAGSLIAVKIGQRDVETAEYTLGNVVLLNVVIGTLFAIASLIWLDPILRFFGASDSSLPYAREYMVVLLCGNVLTHLYLGLNDVVRSSGYPGRAMAATLTAVLVNVLFDYVFIVLFEWGIRGAAFATLLAQFVALCVVLRHLCSRDAFIRFKRGIFGWRPRIIKAIIGVGLSPFCTNSCACLVVLLVNNSLLDYGGDTYIGAFGIVNRVSFIFVMVAQGICQGMQPIAGFNYGAGLIGRTLRVYKYAIVGGMSVMSLGFLLAELCPTAVARLFTSDSELIIVTAHALRIALAAFAIVGFQIVTSGFMMALRKAPQAIVMSVSRQLLCLAPLIVVLPRFFGVDGVWYAMPLSDLFATLVAAALSFRQVGRLRQMV